MKSAFAMTYELLDMQAAAEELAAGVAGIQLQKNSLGVLFCDSELDNHETLVRALRDKLGFDIIGVTTLATLNKDDGISEMSSALMVLTGDDCWFQAVKSRPIEPATVYGTIVETYEQLLPQCPEQPAMLLAYPPHKPTISLDVYPQTLSKLSGNTPVFGGTPGHNNPYGTNGIVFNDNIYADCMLLIGIGGHIKPVCTMGIQLSYQSKGRYAVTESQDNVIKRVNGMDFFEFLRSVDLDPDEMVADETKVLFVKNPMLFTSDRYDGEEYKLVRTLYSMNAEERSGHMIGIAPKEHNISMTTLTRKDIEDATRIAIGKLLEKIRAQEEADPSYKYTTVLASSCLGRYMVMTPKTEIEGDVFKQMIPEHLNFMGYYGYGELGPVTLSDGSSINTSQNETLTMVAF